MFFLLGMNAFSQKQKLDSVLVSSFDSISNSYIVSTKYVYEYDKKGNMVSLKEYFQKGPNNSIGLGYIYNGTYDINGNKTALTVIYMDENNTPVNNTKDEYGYDTKGNEILLNTYNWNTTKKEWVASFTNRTEYTYNSNGNIVSAIYYEISSAPSRKKEITYNSKNQITSTKYYNWDIENNQWVDSRLTLFSFDSNGNTIKEVSSIINGNSTWINYYQYESLYDEFGNNIQMNYSKWDTSLNSWNEYSRVNSKYNNSFLNSEILWPSKQYINDYQKHMIVEYSSENYVNNIWKKEGKNDYYYSSFENSGIDEVVISKVLIYPNPTNGIFTINTGQTNIASIKVYDIAGKVVFTTTASNKQNEMQIDLSDLNNGVYFVQVISEDSNKSISKIILAK